MDKAHPGYGNTYRGGVSLALERNKRHRSVALVALSAGAIAVAGCGSDTTEVGASPPVEEVASSAAPEFVRATAEGDYSPENPPAQPPLPHAANQRSSEGATTFVQYWVDTLNHAWFTGDTAELRRISSPECQSCTNFVESIEATYPDGAHRGGAASISLTGALDVTEDSASVVAAWESGAEVRLDSQGAVIAEAPRSQAALTTRLAWQEDGWQTDTLLLEPIE